MKPLLQATGRFTTPPGAEWRIFVCPNGSRASLTHNERREKALRQISLSEERISRRGALDVLFGMPPTHEFFLERSRLGIPQIIVRIPARIKGTAVNKDDHTVTSEAKQLRQLLSFWKALLVNDGKGRSADWRYVQPVTEAIAEDEAEPFNAYHWWINALVSRYISFFGVFEYPDRRNINPIPPPKKISNDDGFTLTELVVVILIVGILAVIALPTFLGYVQRARETETIVLLSRLATEVTAYRSNYGEYPSDLTPGQYPQGVDPSVWPEFAEVKTEFDYEYWSTPRGCVVAFTNYGANNRRDHAVHQRYGNSGEIVRIGPDDIIKIIDVDENCNLPLGAVK
ncbi:MAG: prepilin-type N-terminal cleavage/methylation domain-containing protein [Cyanobacteria bacterium P01_C01_bin.120]